MKLCGGDVQDNLLEVLSFLQWEDIDSIGWFECRRYIQLVNDLYIQIRKYDRYALSGETKLYWITEKLRNNEENDFCYTGGSNAALVY